MQTHSKSDRLTLDKVEHQQVASVLPPDELTAEADLHPRTLKTGSGLRSDWLLISI